MVVVDHLQVERHVGVVDSHTTTPLEIASEVVSLFHAVGQVILNLLHLISQALNLNVNHQRDPAI